MFRSFYPSQLSFVFGFVLVIAAWFGPLEMAKAQTQGSLSTPLDLVSLSRIHLEGYLTRSPERLPEPEGFYRASFPCQPLPVPTCGHDQWEKCRGSVLLLADIALRIVRLDRGLCKMRFGLCSADNVERYNGGTLQRKSVINHLTKRPCSAGNYHNFSPMFTGSILPS